MQHQEPSFAWWHNVQHTGEGSWEVVGQAHAEQAQGAHLPQQPSAVTAGTVTKRTCTREH